MNKDEFHKRIKEILIANRDPNNSPSAHIHEIFSNEVTQRSDEDWDETIAEQVIRQLEWATNTQPKQDKISEPDIKTMVSDFVEKRGYIAVPIVEGSEKTPDFSLEKSASKYLLEIKSPVLNFNVEKQLYIFKTSHTKILNHIHTAIKQFTEQDKDHNLPWILLFTSSHPQLNWSTLVDVLHGTPVDERHRAAPAYYSTIPLIQQLDGIIWLQANVKAKIFHQASYLLNKTSAYEKHVNQLIVDLSVTKLPNGMDNNLVFSVKSKEVKVSRVRI